MSPQEPQPAEEGVGGPDYNHHDFDLASAQAAAAEGRIDDWVDRYLRAGEWANLPFAEGLKLAPRWWVGPLRVDLEALAPALGSGAAYEYDIPGAQLAAWVDRLVGGMLADSRDLPPMIAEYRHGELSLRDGNKRYWAMKQLGWHHCWTLIWFNTPAELDAYRLQQGGGVSASAQASDI